MNPCQWILVGLVRGYQWTLSPLKSALLGPGARCRFTPRCSQYALEAVKEHGALVGGWLAIRRLARCHPWGECGDDPVPPVRAAKTTYDESMRDRSPVAARCRH
jgi:putative membrane protein insertion efficiency factor